jgi:drug/metabolite transporter (DMT)-like permease
LALVTLLAYAVLRETVTPTRWAGVAVICVGVFLVGRTAPSTTEAD